MITQRTLTGVGYTGGQTGMEDLGFPDRNVVGHYTYHDLNLYIDTENLEILQAWFGDEEDEL